MKTIEGRLSSMLRVRVSRGIVLLCFYRKISQKEKILSMSHSKRIRKNKMKYQEARHYYRAIRSSYLYFLKSSPEVAEMYKESLIIMAERMIKNDIFHL